MVTFQAIAKAPHWPPAQWIADHPYTAPLHSPGLLLAWLASKSECSNEQELEGALALTLSPDTGSVPMSTPLVKQKQTPDSSRGYVGTTVGQRMRGGADYSFNFYVLLLCSRHKVMHFKVLQERSPGGDDSLSWLYGVSTEFR